MLEALLGVADEVRAAVERGDGGRGGVLVDDALQVVCFTTKTVGSGGVGLAQATRVA